MIEIHKIPFNEIETAGLSLKDKDKVKKLTDKERLDRIE